MVLILLNILTIQSSIALADDCKKINVIAFPQSNFSKNDYFTFPEDLRLTFKEIMIVESTTTDTGKLFGPYPKGQLNSDCTIEYNKSIPKVTFTKDTSWKLQVSAPVRRDGREMDVKASLVSLDGQHKALIVCTEKEFTTTSQAQEAALYRKVNSLFNNNFCLKSSSDLSPNLNVEDEDRIPKGTGITQRTKKTDRSPANKKEKK